MLGKRLGTLGNVAAWRCRRLEVRPDGCPPRARCQKRAASMAAASRRWQCDDCAGLAEIIPSDGSPATGRMMQAVIIGAGLATNFAVEVVKREQRVQCGKKRSGKLAPTGQLRGGRFAMAEYHRRLAPAGARKPLPRAINPQERQLFICRRWPRTGHPGRELRAGDRVLPAQRSARGAYFHSRVTPPRPQRPPALVNLGAVYKPDFEKVRRRGHALRKASSSQPTGTRGVYNLGRRLSPTREQLNGRPAYREATCHQPERPTPTTNLANIYLEKKNSSRMAIAPTMHAWSCGDFWRGTARVESAPGRQNPEAAARAPPRRRPPGRGRRAARSGSVLDPNFHGTLRRDNAQAIISMDARAPQTLLKHSADDVEARHPRPVNGLLFPKNPGNDLNGQIRSSTSSFAFAVATLRSRSGKRT